MNHNEGTIHLAIAFDKQYVRHFLALLSSVFESTKKGGLHFHLIAPDVSIEQREGIETYIASHHARVEFYSFDQKVADELVLTGDWTPAVYYRLFFPLLVPVEAGRILYLDSDTLVLNDLSELFHEDMEGYPVAAVYDVYVQEQRLIGVAEGNYFNSGVLLIDLQKWREQNITEKTLDYLKQYPQKILYVDQCGLNAVLKGNWKHLSARYNLLYSYIPQDISNGDLQRFISDKVIVHFTIHRPWTFLCRNRYRYLYWKYLKMNPLAGRSAIAYSDFSVSKIPEWINIRMIELYFDHAWLRRIWRIVKQPVLK